MSEKIDRTKIEIPQIEITPRAALEWNLLIENDYTLEDKILRIQIYGKECDGFTYAVGFTSPHPDDFIVDIFLDDKNKAMGKIYLDPFSAFYLREATLDFQVFREENEILQGFLVINHHQDKYKGKFWRKNETLIPPTLKEETLWV